MAYGAKGDRNGLHAEGKHQHGWWCVDREWETLKRISKSLGLRSVTGILHGIAIRELIVTKAKTMKKEER